MPQMGVGRHFVAILAAGIAALSTALVAVTPAAAQESPWWRGDRALILGDGGGATQAGMTAPVGLAIDGQGRLFISERDGQVVRQVAGGVITGVAGSGRRGTGPGSLDDPAGLALAGGALYLAEAGAGRVTEIAITH
jgi:hypothetical protein